MCPLHTECPFYRSNRNSTREHVRKAIRKYCHGNAEGCAQRRAKESYDTFLAMNQTPEGTCLSL